MATNYERGRQYEYRSMRALEDVGYETVRTAGSHGPFDVAGFSGTDVILVQVKFQCEPSPAEIEKFRLYPAPPGVRKAIHRWDKGSRHPKVRLL